MTQDAALLGELRRATVHVPRTELAALLRTDTTAIVKRIDELRAAGFEIDEQPVLGYRLVKSPDRLIADDLRARLGPSAFIRDILVFEETDSTNQRAIQLGETGAAGGVAIFAERQTAGRGRFGRRWESASHLGLWFSLLLRPTLPLAMWSRLTTWAAVVAAEAIEECSGLSIAVKWPNDLELDGRKLAGILIETTPDSAGGHFAVVGVGVNVNHDTDNFPPDLRDRATSLRLATRRFIDRGALAAAILHAMTRRAADIGDAGFPALLDAARRRSSLIGRHIALECAGTRIEGRAEDLAPDGRLQLRLASGELETVGAGEATIVPEPRC
ncbi:MAG: biotin--[acetyl-CoA-carboxylase] ligase [Chthoniobacteraceae bacterium]